MSLLLICSTLFGLIAFLFSALLCFRRRDWHLGFLPLLLLIFSVEQGRQLYAAFGRPVTAGWHDPAQISSFLISLFGLLAVLFLARSLSREKHLLAQLQAQQEQTRALLDHLPDVVWMASPDGRKMLLINQATRQVYGREPEAFYDNPQLWLEAVHPEDRARVETRSQDLFRRGQVELEYRIVRPDGSIRWILERKSVVRDPAGQPLFLFGVGIDITARVESEQRFQMNQRLLAEAEQVLNMGIFEWEVAEDRLTWSPGLFRIYGIGPDRFSGHVADFLQFVAPEDQERVQQLIQQALAGQERINYSEKIRRADGQPRVLQTVGYILRNETGQPVRMIGLCRDVTEEYQIQQEVQRQQQRLEGLLETTLDGFILADDRGRILQVNPAYCRMTGFTREELLKKNIAEQEALLSPQQVAEKIEQMVTAGGAQFETRHWRKDGSQVDLAVSITVFAEEERHLVAAFVRDISEQKRWRQRLLDQKRKLDLALTAARMGIWEWDVTTDRVYWSENVEALFGLAPGEFKGTYQAFLDTLVPEYRAVVQEAIQKTLNGNRPYQVSYAITTPEGKIRWHEARGMLIRNQRGEPLRMLGTVMDITEQKQAELKIRRTQEQLRALAAHLQSVREEERTLIAREMHDELGQVLTALKMDLSLMLREVKRSPLPEALAFLPQEVQGMIAMIDQTIRRVRQLITELRPEILDHLELPEAVRWQVQEFSRRSNIPCNLSLEGDLSHLSPEYRLAVFRILQEGLTNIARHARASQARVKLVAQGEKLYMQIEDNGQGIPAEKLEAKTSFGLLGIRERVLLLNGTLSIHSQPGKGTCLDIELPFPAQSHQAAD
ncbi:MAG: PAS domain S-box protein [Calditrichaeota bacterium]|nr:MAG: PAS domain S-box protein [Calditrichota bacterium]